MRLMFRLNYLWFADTLKYSLIKFSSLSNLWYICCLSSHSICSRNIFLVSSLLLACLTAFYTLNRYNLSSTSITFRTSFLFCSYLSLWHEVYERCEFSWFFRVKICRVMRALACCCSESQVERRQMVWDDVRVRVYRFCYRVEIYSCNCQSNRFLAFFYCSYNSMLRYISLFLVSIC